MAKAGLKKYQTDFPKIIDLPLALNPECWCWTKTRIGTGMDQRKFWIGTDEEGKRWIVKMHGKFDAVRERVPLV